MPIFDYKCVACGHVEEDIWIATILISGDHPVLTCPDCGGSMHRMFSAPGKPVFHGNGFYETDYKKKGGE